MFSLKINSPLKAEQIVERKKIVRLLKFQNHIQNIFF